MKNVRNVGINRNASRIFLKSTEAEPISIPKARIARRVNQPSSMPPMGRVISRRELRDLIEYLANLKGKRGR